ncbi:MAG: TPM domain-containing protein [Bacilli bacterium]|nr:TPM domain-containing protein [Bacilli bacterium]
MKKYIYYLIFILILFLIWKLPASAKEFKTCIRTETNLHVKDYFIKGNNLNDIMTTPCVFDSDKIYDYANLLTDSEEEKLYDEVWNYIETTGFDLAIVTINENVKGSAVYFADDFYDYNSFGKGETRDGSLFLIDMDTRKVYMSTTGNAILMYSDDRIGNDEEYQNTGTITDYGYDYVVKQEYYNAFSEMIKRALYFYNLGYPESNKNIEINEIGKPIVIHYLNYPFIGGISLFITLIIAIIFYNITRLKIKVGSTISYLKEKNITTRNDRLVNTIVTHTLRNTDSGGSSGHSGGSSYHSSSSGGFHGGGGRSF